MFTKIEDMLQKREDLHSDLLPYLSGDKTMIRHPLVYSIMHNPLMNSMVNAQYLSKKSAIEQAVQERDFSSYIFLHERPYRLAAFMDIQPEMTDKEFWVHLSHVWVDSENIWQNLSTWKALFKSTRKGRENFMSKEERKFLKELPSEVTVYRGHVKGKNKNGLSYTLDKGRAEWFANRFHENGQVLSKGVQKEKIFAYLDRRGEKEIILT